MPLSRLENFLKNAEGNILYVNPSDFDATDGYENQGNSLTRPFRTIQRALIEAARFSYQTGRNNDKIDRTTILVYPGTHYIDNRPGFSVENIGGSAVYKKRTDPTTWTEAILSQFGRNTVFDILNPDNDLYKFNSVHGGVILPRGTSIIGLDLRKTKIRPLYVPDPQNNDVENSSIFNVTGTCYFSTFTFFDADITRDVYKDYSDSKYVPSFSHHKLVSFTYADGVNKVVLGNTQTDLTDLDMYYYKVAKAYGDFSGRGIADYPSNEDFEPSVDEYRIVGTLQANPLGISSITSGDGITSPNNLITVTTVDTRTGEQTPHNLYVDSPVYVDGITREPDVYNGSFTVKDVVGLTTFTYIADSVPTEAIVPNDYSSATVLSESDTVSSASPYVFNCSIRSVFGLCGMWANGAKADGFKSMVVAQFTGVSLQKDDNAFMIYENGNYEDNFTLSVNSPERPLHSNSRAKYKPDYESFHIRVSDNGFVQCVSIFAIGFSKHFVTESGGDMSITNSNSNFGAVSLQSEGFRDESFNRDDVGYITHIIPPKEGDSLDQDVTWVSLDTDKITSIGDTSKLYLFGYNFRDIVPPHQVDGYRVGAKINDKLNLILSQSGGTQSTFETPIVMPSITGDQITSKKEYLVVNDGVLNSIDTNGVITLNTPHSFIGGESLRVFSDDGTAPDNIECDVVYFAITSEENVLLSSNQVQLAFSANDALSANAITDIGNNGGKLTLVSSVSDKLPGEIGHPIQYDTTNQGWYITGAASSETNTIYKGIVDSGVDNIELESPSTFIVRKLDDRSIEDRIYKVRYVIPKEFEFARPPQAGFILQESKTVEPSLISFNQNLNITEFTPPEYLRNDRIIIDATADPVVNGSQTITITTEKPHNLLVGDKVKIGKVKSTNNPTGVGLTSTYNGSYYVKSVNSRKEFTYEISGVKVNPGDFANDINQRDTNLERENLPIFSRDEYKNTTYIYRVTTVREHIPGTNGQDGVYYLILLSSNVSVPDNINFGVSEKKFSQDVRHLYPQIDRDNINYDPKEITSSANLKVFGNVLVDDRRNSTTKESVNNLLKNNRVGFAITAITTSGVGNTTVRLYSDLEHGLNSIKSLNVNIPGSGYGTTTLHATPLLGGTGTGAAVKASFNASGVLQDIFIVDYGTGYSVSDILIVEPHEGVTPTQNAVLSVSSLNNNINDGLELSGFANEEFNGTFKILNVPSEKTVDIYVPTVSSIPSINPSGKKLPFGVISSDGIIIDSITSDPALSGIVTVTTSSSHGLLTGNKFTLVGTGTNTYDGTHHVLSLDSTSPLTKFNFFIENLNDFSTSSSGLVFKSSFYSNQANIGDGEEFLGSRVSYIYDGLSATLATELTTNTTNITFSSAAGYRRGDYVSINNEIIRLASSPSANSFNIIRGEFGTSKSTAPIGTVIKKIRVLPMELRRPSFMRASGHTFEYLGYGPGNYSTGMPQKQDLTLSEEEVLTSQSRKQKGGIVVYSAMNDLGEFFSGNKKQSSTTGEETIVEAPILTYTGDDAKGNLSGRLSEIFDDLLIRERLTVEGGPNNNQTSQFYGPVNFTEKLTNTSEKGINTKKLFVRGKQQQGKQITVGIGTTSGAVKNDIISPRKGDIVLTSDPIPQKHVGFVNDGSDWYKYGLISQRKDILDIEIDRLGIGDPTVFDSFGGVGDRELYVAGDIILDNVVIVGSAVFDSQVILNDVQFRDLDIRGTATYDIIAPLSGLSTSFTQIHKDGTSLLNNVDIVGVTTFRNTAYFNSDLVSIGGTFGNIQIGVTNDNEIDTSTGVLTIDSSSGITIIDDNLKVTDGYFESSTTNAGVGNTVYTKILDSKTLQIGVGNTTNSAKIDLYQADETGLSLERKTVGFGTGDAESVITHYGLENFKLGTKSISNLSLFTNDTERLKVSYGGTVTAYQSNSGTGLKGAHFSINQSSSGDSVISWVNTYQNTNQRWYAGLDKSDSHKWKLAYPSQSVSSDLEEFENPDETKLSVETSGETTIFGPLNIENSSSSNVSSIKTTKQTFNLLDSNVLVLNFARSAREINVASTSSDTFVNVRSPLDASNTTNGALRIAGGVGIAKKLFVGSDAKVNGTTESTSKDTGAFIVEGGVGIEKNLNVGGSLDITGSAEVLGAVHITNATESGSGSSGSLIVDGGLGVKKKLFVEGDVRFTSTTESNDYLTGALLVEGGVGIAKSVYIGGATDSTSKSTGSLVISGGVGIDKNLYVGNNLRINGTAESTSKNTGSLTIDGGVGVAKKLNIGSIDQSTSISTGAVRISGGIGIAKNAYIGNDAKILGTTESSSVSTGALVVSGGVGISKNLNVAGSLDVDTNATVNGSLFVDTNLDVDGTSRLGGQLRVDIGIIPGTNKGAYLGSSTLRFGYAYANDIRIGVSGATEIDTTSGNLILDSSGGTVQITDNANVTGNLDVDGTLNVDSTSQFDGAVNMSSTLTVANLIDGNGGATIKNVRIGVGGDNEIDTSTGELLLDSSSGTVRVNDNLDVDGTLNVDSTSQFDGAVNMSSTLAVTGLITGSISGNAVTCSRNVIAGNGLTGGGVLSADRTLNVGQGDGISVAADSISVDSTVLRTTGGQSVSGSSYFEEIYIGTGSPYNISLLSDGTINCITLNGTATNCSRTITTGNGLTGGGDLTENRTLNVGSGDGISVAANAVAVDSTVVRTSGNQTIGGTKTFSGIPAFNGGDASNAPFTVDSSVKVTNLNADLLDGRTTATGATGNTIALRDSDGDITGRYLYGSYMNMSHSAADRNSDTVFYSSTDDFIRKNTASGFRTSLDVPTRTGGDASGTWAISISGTATNCSRTITTGNGLTGGGDLTANRTLNVGQGDGISVAANAVAVDSTVVRTSGNQTIGGTKTFSKDISGNLSGTATNATNVNLATRNNNSDTHYVVFGALTSGNQRLYTDTGLTYQPSTNTLFGTFSGTFTGTSSDASNATNATNATNVDLATRNNNSDTHYVVFGASTSGNQRLFTDTGLTYQPSTNTLSGTFSGSLNGTATNCSRSVVAGNGLTGGGALSADRTLNVGSGDGISVAADSVAVDSTVVRTTRTITAGSGLTGGGALSANRTLAVDSTVVRTTRTITAGSGLTGGGALSANRTLAVDSTVVRTSGNQTIGGTKTFSGSANINGNLVVDGNITNGAFDFILGNKDQSSRGDSGVSRALIKDSDATLVINFEKDFSGGTIMHGPVTGSVFAAAKFENGSRVKSKNISSHTTTFSGTVIYLTINYTKPAIGNTNLVHSGMARDSTYAGAYVVGPAGQGGSDTENASSYTIYNNFDSAVNVGIIDKLSIVVHQILGGTL